MVQLRSSDGGFTLVEMVTALGVFSIIALSILGLYTTLISTTILMKQKAIGLSVATNQLEYVKSLPFTGMAVSGGSIYSTNPIASTRDVEVNKVTYKVKTSINYIDDAFDGCGPYSTAALKAEYCRNQPAPSGSSTDTNPQDYKVVNIRVLSETGATLAETDTQIAAKVAETASTTGALFITVNDETGNPLSGVNVNVGNATTAPVTNLNDSTDSNGVAIFYGLIPDSAYDYVLTATKEGYSTLSTIRNSGSLVATYPNAQILTQQSSQSTLTIMKQHENSILIEAVDTNGNPLSNQRIMAKGGYKRFTEPTNTDYYYSTTTSPDNRPITNAQGLATLKNLVPGPYIFCGDLGVTSCTQTLVAAVPYQGSNSLNPVAVTAQDAGTEPTTGYTLDGSNYVQKVRLIFSTSTSFPRVRTLKPDNLSIANTPLSAFTFQVAGTNLPCSNTASSCTTKVFLKNATNTYTASCTGNTGSLLNCRVNLTGVSAGMLQLVVTVGSNTLNLPTTPLLGGLNVNP